MSDTTSNEPTNTTTRKRLRRPGTEVLKPADVAVRYGIVHETRWRWEKAGRLPPRDVFSHDGRAIGWRLSTIERSERGEAAA